jgi:F0F1-type ATP synthase membrane subunit c/vacuolar-type H+-ATPase subunit K
MNDQFGTPSEQPKNNRTMIIIGVVVAVLLCCCCITVAVGYACGDMLMGTAASCGF